MKHRLQFSSFAALLLLSGASAAWAQTHQTLPEIDTYVGINKNICFSASISDRSDTLWIMEGVESARVSKRREDHG